MHKIIRLPEVINRTGLARSTIYKKMAEKSFPLQLSLGPKAVGWLEEDVVNWINNVISLSQKPLN